MSLRLNATTTSATKPRMGFINVYDATAAPLSVLLPSLSDNGVGASVMVQKSALDVSINTVGFATVGSDAFDDGSTTMSLTTPGAAYVLQVVSLSGVKKWKVIGTLEAPVPPTDYASVVAVGTHSSVSEPAPDDADEVPLVDVSLSGVLRRLTWANLKAAIGPQVAVSTHAAASKTVPASADEIPLVDSAASNTLKRLTMGNLRATVAPPMVFNVKDPAYGAVGDGVADDAPAIQLAINAAQVGGASGGGVVYFPPGYYKLGSTLLVKESNVTLAGASTGSVKLLITSAAATYPAITFTGYLNGTPSSPSSNATFAWNFAVRDLWIEKATPVANATAAISTSCIQFARFHNVHIRGFGTGILCSASFNVYAHQVHIQSNSAATISTLYGWKFDSTYSNFSCYLSHCTVGFGGENIDPAAGTVVTSYAYYNSGAHPSDWFLDHCEAATCTYGYYYSGAAAAAWTDVLDIHFVECVADQCQYGFRIADNLTASTTGGQVDITSCYWANRYTTVTPTPTSYGIAVSNSSGVTVRGFQAFSGNPSSPTNYQNNYGVVVDGGSKDVSISGVNLKGNAVAGIYLLNSSYVTVFGNTILQTLSIGANGVLLSGSTNVSIVGNTIRSVSGLTTPMANGINVDATSSARIGHNIVDTATVTTPLTVASGGNATATNNLGITDRGVSGIMGTANQTADTTFTTTTTDITGVSVTFTAVPGRKYRTVVSNVSASSTVAGDRIDLSITNSSNTRVSPLVATTIANANGLYGSSPITVVETGLSGSNTRKLRGVRGSGTGTGKVFYDGSFFSTITVEDIGPA